MASVPPLHREELSPLCGAAIHAESMASAFFPPGHSQDSNQKSAFETKCCLCAAVLTLQPHGSKPRSSSKNWLEKLLPARALPEPSLCSVTQGGLPAPAPILWLTSGTPKALGKLHSVCFSKCLCSDRCQLFVC